MNIIHIGVQCNVCGKNPITYYRYKCLVCKDYNLCDVCNYIPDLHDETHLVIQYKVPEIIDNKRKIIIDDLEYNYIKKNKII